jgi:hypothetical protein
LNKLIFLCELHNTTDHTTVIEGIERKDYQPDPKNKSNGWKRRRFNRYLIKTLLQSPYKFTLESLTKGEAKKIKVIIAAFVSDVRFTSFVL